MPHPIRAIACLCCFMLATVSWYVPSPVSAHAQPSSLPKFQNLAAAVTIDRGLTCLDSAELVERIASWLGADRISAPLSIEVNGSPYFARTVWFRIQRGKETLAERRFDPAPARCADLHAAVGLAIALALKASQLDSPTQQDAREKGPFRIAAQAVGGVAVVPGSAFGVGASLQLAASGRFAARASGLALFGPHGGFEQDQGHFNTWLAIGRIELCWRLVQLARLDFSACVGVAAGALAVAGEAFPLSRRALVPYVAVASALELDVVLSSHWSVGIELDLLVPLRHTSFVVRDQASKVLATHDLAAAGALFAIGPAYHF